MQDVLTVIPGLSGKLGRNDGIGSEKAAFFPRLCDDCPQGPFLAPDTGVGQTRTGTFGGGTPLIDGHRSDAAAFMTVGAE